MSNNKQSRIYQCIELLNKGVNNLSIQTTIINAYEKVIRKNNALKEYIEKLVLDLQDKKKVISSQEEINTQLIKSNKYLIEQINKNTRLGLDIEEVKLLEENRTLKETNKNLLEISEGYQEELTQQSEYIGELKEYIEDLSQDLKMYSSVLENISLEEASNLKKDNEELKKRYDYLEKGVLKYQRHETKRSFEVKSLKEENEKLKQEVNKLILQKSEQAEKINAMSHYALKHESDMKMIKEENEKLKDELVYKIQLANKLYNLMFK